MNIGDKTWFKGNEVTVTTNPYEKYGGMWFDAITDQGKTVSIVTKDQKAINLAKQRNEHQSMQNGFRKLRNNT